MSTLITEMHSHAFDFDRLAPSAQTEIHQAQQEAARMRAPEVYPEHLFLGVLAQSDDRVARVMNNMGLDMRAIRAQVLSLRERDFIEAAVSLDLGTPHIIFRELLPNMMSFVTISFILATTGAIYQQVGFVHRRTFQLAVLKPPSPSQ